MLSITVNGIEKKLNIGCRTFVYLDEILSLLGRSQRPVLLNGRAVPAPATAKTVVNGGDRLEVQ